MKLLFVLLCFILLSVEYAWAGAACCSIGGSTTSLITNEDRGQISLGVTGSTTIGSSSNSGDVEFFHRDMHDRSLRFLLSGVVRVSDRFQIGSALNLVRRDVKNLNREASNQGIGDSSASINFLIAPRILSSLTIGFPTGQSEYETENIGIETSTGSGQWSLQAGTLLLQNWGAWDLSFNPKAQYSFEEDFKHKGSRVELGDRWILSSLVKGGRSFLKEDSLRLGVGVGPQWQSPTSKRDRFGKNDLAHRLVIDSLFEIGFSPLHGQSLNLTYTDQTLLGPTNNTALTRSLALQYVVGFH